MPVSEALPDYRVPTDRRDVFAAVTVAALAIPSAMAYAELAGVTPIAGLYALLLPTVAYALLGSSRQLIVGPEGSLSALVGTAVLPLAVAGSGKANELAATLALLVGACFLVARLLRIGWVADYFSRPVLIGYMHGVAVVLIVGQLSYRLDDRLFFANASCFKARVREALRGAPTSPRSLVLERACRRGSRG